MGPPAQSPSEPSDEGLLARIAGGDEEAFAAFYDRHAPLLYAIGFRVLGDEAEAQDALQEALLLIWERAPGFDPRLGRPLSWAVTLTRNKAVDRLRARARRDRTAVEAAAVPNLDARPGEVESPARHTVAAETAEVVKTALARLSGDQQQAIELAFYGGLSQTEIAALLGQPLGTVKARIRRGMLELRDALGPLGQS